MKWEPYKVITITLSSCEFHWFNAKRLEAKDKIKKNAFLLRSTSSINSFVTSKYDKQKTNKSNEISIDEIRQTKYNQNVVVHKSFKNFTFYLHKTNTQPEWNTKSLFPMLCYFMLILEFGMSWNVCIYERLLLFVDMQKRNFEYNV